MIWNPHYESMEREKLTKIQSERLCELVRKIASGTMTKSETLKFQDVSQCFLMDAGF
jgi:altronate dehydratase